MTKAKGRASKYSQKTAVALCEQLAKVGSIGKACAAVGVARSTFYEWLHEHAQFVGMCQAAKEAYADDLFDTLADLMEKDPPRDEKGRGDAAFAHMARVRLDALKYRLRVLNPRKFAEQRVELTGGEGEPLNPPPRERNDETFLEDVRRLAFLLSKADHIQARKREGSHPQPTPGPEPAADAPLLLPAPEAEVAPTAQDSGDEQPEYVVVGNRLVRSDIGGGLKDINGDGTLYDLGPPSYKFEE